MTNIIAVVLVFGIPLASVILFVCSLIRYLDAKGQNRERPGAISPEQMKRLRTQLIISSVILGVLVAVVVGIVVLLYLAIAYM